MPYVQRNGGGTVTGLFHNKQPGYAEEFLADNHAEVIAYLTPKVKRNILAIVTDLVALSTAKKNAIWTDITSGSPQKWTTNNGINGGPISLAHVMITEGGLTAAAILATKLRAVAMYVQDNPRYLINPAFDPTINIPGES